MRNHSFINDPSIPDIIELKGISQVYGKKVVIDGLDLLLENNPGQNQLISLLGPSGCGKSTILKYIAGLKTPTTGEVFLYEKPADRNTIVGMVFQDYSSFPWRTVLENVCLGLEFNKEVSASERMERGMEMLKLVRLEGQAKQYSSSLSGGQKQRVAIARSLLASPKILLMDEPFGALDADTRFEMQDLMQTLITEKLRDTAIIFVTHDISEAVFLSDDILLMQAGPGRIVEKIKVNLPNIRTKALKREAKFNKMVCDIEDKMSNLVAKSKAEAEAEETESVTEKI